MTVRIGPPMTDRAGLLRLTAWLSPAFPVGAFAYSHGLERAIADGAVHDRASLEDWLTSLMRHGTGWTDAVLFAESWRSCAAPEVLEALCELARAMASSRERQAEALALGRAFLDAVGQTREVPEPLASVETAYPIAVGAVCGGEGIGLEASLSVFGQAFTSNLVSVAQRLVPLGQADALKAISALEPLHVEMSAKAAESTLDDLGSAAFLSDIAAMRHENLQPRIFRT